MRTMNRLKFETYGLNHVDYLEEHRAFAHVEPGFRLIKGRSAHICEPGTMLTHKLSKDSLGLMLGWVSGNVYVMWMVPP